MLSPFSRGLETASCIVCCHELSHVSAQHVIINILFIYLFSILLIVCCHELSHVSVPVFFLCHDALGRHAPLAQGQVTPWGASIFTLSSRLVGGFRATLASLSLSLSLSLYAYMHIHTMYTYYI